MQKAHRMKVGKNFGFMSHWGMSLGMILESFERGCEHEFIGFNLKRI